MTTTPPVMTREDLIGHIRTIPGSTGWWHEDGFDRFVRIADNLTAMGWPPDAILDLLEDVYGAVANEYGD